MNHESADSRPASLALRVTALAGVAILCCLLIIGWIVQRSIANHFAEQDADELRVVAEAVQQALATAAPQNSNRLKATLPAVVSGHHGVYFGVFRRNGETLYATAGPDLRTLVSVAPTVADIAADNLYQWTETNRTYRVAVLAAGSDADLWLVVASSMDFHLEFMADFANTLWIIMIIASAVTLLATWFAVQYGHRPLHRLSAEIRAIRTDKLHLRLETAKVPQELQELVASFNDMLGGMEDVFSRLSNFSADIAHELRTPITNLTTQTEVALGQARTVEEYRDVLYSNLEEYDRLATMVADMLWLAKTDNGMLKPAFVDIDLATEIRALFDFYEAWAEEREVALTLQGEATAIHGDRAMLRRALGNLLANAVRHTPQHQAVTATIANEGDSARITIENPGPTIAPDQLPKIFDRFYRVDPARSRRGEGVGLGLAIVQAIVTIHGGSIAVTSANQVTAFTLLLPANRESQPELHL
ncbi:MAG: histidine kinase [Gammaproteobacteria bacterium BRH_c0]|nr:MAG: histidine kinase [Gammaproteobacteria bacterium BRH_c0]